ncbi:MAG: small multi-drug export protein [Clostridiales bacterium]|nr:small multi-drug export protein [Clostridiales bacterium]
MIEAIENFFLETVGREWCVFFCSMIPIIELRGAIPLGAAMGLHPLLCFGISIVGNMLPVPFILLFINAIIQAMKKTKHLARFANWLEAKAEKNKKKILSFGFFGLVLFVGIPIPGTGAWTGSLAGSVLRLPFWRALLATFLGVLMAGTIMTIISIPIYEIAIHVA